MIIEATLCCNSKRSSNPASRAAGIPVIRTPWKMHGKASKTLYGEPLLSQHWHTPQACMAQHEEF